MILQSLVRPAQPSGHPTQSLLAPRERLPGQVAETLQQVLQLLKRVQLVRAQQFGCCRRCRRPEICDQIGDGEVDFMANADTMGSSLAKMALATDSSLNACRSSESRRPGQRSEPVDPGCR